MRVENENARTFYLEEAIKSNWSTRQLDRQINSFFYERLLSNQNKEEVSNEIMAEASKRNFDLLFAYRSCAEKIDVTIQCGVKEGLHSFGF